MFLAIQPKREANEHLQQNNRLVWNAAHGLMMELFEDVWGEEKDEIYVEQALDLGVRVCLYPSPSL